jgi:hypothetical protein
LQAPFVPHVAAGVTAQRPRGSIVPAGTGAQLPAAPATPQDAQLGQLATPQHTASTQWPLTHCGSLEHATPFESRLVHEVPTQDDPTTQSLALAHVVRHAALPHA